MGGTTATVSPLLLAVLFFCPARTAMAECPWGRDPSLVSLQSSCLCGLGPQLQLSVQCSDTNFNILSGNISCLA